MCFGLFKDSRSDFKRSELLYYFIKNLAGVIKLYASLRVYLVKNVLFWDWKVKEYLFRWFMLNYNLVKWFSLNSWSRRDVTAYITITIKPEMLRILHHDIWGTVSVFIVDLNADIRGGFTNLTADYQK